MAEQDAQDKGFVGVFDSGVGGLTVLGCLVAELPHERFVFFGDSAHAPPRRSWSSRGALPPRL